MKPGVFVPPPKIDSVYFSMVFKDSARYVDSALMGFIRQCFENKRKYLKYALIEILRGRTNSSTLRFNGFFSISPCGRD